MLQWPLFRDDISASAGNAVRKGGDDMPLIDTLALKTGLVDAGLDSAQAAAIVQAFVHADTEHLATKADIAPLDGRLDKLQWMAGVILALLLLLMGMVGRLLFVTGG